MADALVRTYELSIDCHLDRALLESEGIETQVLFDHFLTLDPLMAQACGGIELRVSQANLERAIQLTEKNVSTVTLENCPRCNSQNLTYDWRKLSNIADWFIFIICFLLGVYPLKYTNVRRCNNCNHCFTFEE
ncbi:hypothetical protein [Nonlabens marinus]|uniref:DUF2007 domain-containing protein n=1 Tax=Nonlabens marinus S1-08 TaxID=1454201 RepID=W8VPX7_9FLAO|nr:hypothetical protein [Nonlabens marinus]BAO54710.1 hypothetical protein NMS_0701 [Nonlabens marinus S1-08]